MQTHPTRYTLRGIPSPRPAEHREPMAWPGPRDIEIESVARQDQRLKIVRSKWLDLLRGRMSLDDLFRR